MYLLKCLLMVMEPERTDKNRLDDKTQSVELAGWRLGKNLVHDVKIEMLK